jgi:hypothetical protein
VGTGKSASDGAVLINAKMFWFLVIKVGQSAFLFDQL